MSNYPAIELHSSEATLIDVTLRSWNTWVGRVSRLFESLSDADLLAEIAPGKNRPVYLLGHLIAANDFMLPQLRLGYVTFPHLREIFVIEPDRAAAELPPISQLRSNWTELNAILASHFDQLSPAQWLERHSGVSEKDFLREPHRNRLSILVGRTNHVSYHLGQLMFLAK